MYKGLRKCEFFTARRNGKETCAVLVSGYFDSNYYYYKDNTYWNTWHAIEPIGGLSVGKGYLLRDAMQKALENTQAARDKIHRDYNWYMNHCAIFRASENERTL